MPRGTLFPVFANSSYSWCGRGTADSVRRAPFELRSGRALSRDGSPYRGRNGPKPPLRISGYPDFNSFVPSLDALHALSKKANRGPETCGVSGSPPKPYPAMESTRSPARPHPLHPSLVARPPRSSILQTIFGRSAAPAAFFLKPGAGFSPSLEFTSGSQTRIFFHRQARGIPLKDRGACC